MGKVFRPTWELNLLLSCFGLSALYSRINSTVTDDPARRPGITQLRYRHGTVWQWKVRFSLTEDSSAPSLFPSSCIIYLCQFTVYIFMLIKQNVVLWRNPVLDKRIQFFRSNNCTQINWFGRSDVKMLKKTVYIYEKTTATRALQPSVYKIIYLSCRARSTYWTVQADNVESLRDLWPNFST